MKVLNTLTFAYELELQDMKINGYKDPKFDLLPLLKPIYTDYICSSKVQLQLGYNHFTEKNYIYICMSIFTSMPEEKIKDLEKECTKIIKELDLKSNFPKVKKKLNFKDTDEVVKFIDIEKIKGFTPIKLLLLEPDNVKIYNNFTKSKIMRNHIEFICKTNSLGSFTKETTYEMLPIHRIEINTNTLLLNNKILPLFKIFKLSDQYLKNYNVNELQFEIAKLMLLDVNFGTYVINSFSNNDKNKGEKILSKVIKQAQSIIKKNDIPELYYNNMEEDLKELFGIN
jgi:hypothetical protein